MAVNDTNSPRPGDDQTVLLRKILSVLGGAGGQGDSDANITAKILAILQNAISGGVTGGTVTGNLTFVGAAPRLNQSVTNAELNVLGGTGKSTGAAIDLHGEDEAGGMPGWLEFQIKGAASSFNFAAFPTHGSLVGGYTVFNISGSGAVTFGAGLPGVVLSNLTTAQRDALASPAAGNLIFNTTTKKLNYYDGTAWQAVA